MDPADLFKSLADETRLRCLALLAAEGELCVCELTHALDLTQPKVSRHLASLRAAGLVGDRKRGQWVYYSINHDLPPWAVAVIAETAQGVAPRAPFAADRRALAAMVGRPDACSRIDPLPERVFNVLFLCSGNSARSIMAEALIGQWGGGRFRAFSAGSHPRGAVHPLTLELLASLGLPTDGLRSKRWEDFAGPDAPKLDFVFTVCDAAAGELCPTWPGQPMNAHWGIPDPAAAEGDELARLAAFRAAFRQLENRIKLFTALRLDALSKLALQQKINDIGKSVAQ